MKKIIVYFAVFITIMVIVGCGGGGSSSNINTEIIDPGVEDTVNPVITVIGGTTSMTVGGTYIAPTVTATDNVDGDITSSIVEAGDVVDPDSAGTYVVTYNVSDSSANAAIQKTHTVVVSTVSNTAPTTPTGLNAQVISSTQIDLSWNASTDDIGVVGYKVYRTGYIRTVSGTSHSETGLTPSTQYCFAVAAYDQENALSAKSEEVCATTTDDLSPWITVQSGTNNDISNIVWTGDKLWVVEEQSSFVLDTTTVQFSTDHGKSWTKQVTSGFGFDGADEVVYGNGRYMAVDRSSIYSSTDGVNWTGVFHTGSFTDIFTVAWSQTLNKYVAGGEDGYIVFSDNGNDWSVLSTSPTLNDIGEIVWLNDRFFALDSQGAIYTSVDGLVWTMATTPDGTGKLSSVTWNGKSGVDALYLAVGWSTVLTSTDGTNWSETTTPPKGSNDKVTWGGGSVNLFIIIGWSNQLYTSPDGETWTMRFMPEESIYAQQNLYDIVWNGSVFTVVGQNGTILISNDGIAWDIVASGSDLNTVIYDGSRFIVGGHNGRMLTSTNSTIWQYSYMGDDSYYIYGIASNGSDYVAVGQQYSLYSSDLSNWNAYWEGGTSVDTAVIYDGNQYIRTGEYGIMTWDGVTTFDGLPDPKWEWSYLNSKLYNDLYWDGTNFVAVGNNGMISTSTDAADGSWTDQNSTVSQHLKAVTKSDTRYVVVGAAGTILISDNDGVTWVAQTSGINVTLNEVTWTGAQFVAVGDSGHILTSDDGETWIDTTHTSVSLNSVTSYNSDIVIVGDKGTLIKNAQ